jgi:thiamine-monophosphate kinase
MNEFDLIQSYFNWEITDPSIELGVGDDAALFTLNPGHQLVTSTDTLVEGIHFFKDASPRDIAYKSLAVNLSDIAAMGATAKCYTLSLTIPELDKEWLKDFSSSLKESSKLFNVHLIGGDTTKGPLNISINMMGSIEINSPIKRSGANEGDDIYVSGELGSAALCLKKIKKGEIPLESDLNSLNRPIPRLELGSALKNLASSCIDVSDGLEQDLSHILKSSGVGAIIDTQELPLSDSVMHYVKDKNDWSLPLCGGDDYELCFTAGKSKRDKISAISESLGTRVTRIGEIISQKKLEVIGYTGPRNSYQHF